MLRAIITFGGFTEDLSRNTGTERLFREVIRKLVSVDLTCLDPRQWDARVEHMVAYLDRSGVKECAVIGYSYGGGYAAQKFAKACMEHGITIKLMLLCDPVYRPTWLPAWGFLQPFAIRSLMPKSATIDIPRSVEEVHWVRQTISLPMAHDLRNEWAPTVIHPPQVLPYGHTAIDESPEWFRLVREKLTAFAQSR
jgi:pimeloyl-ACP methyl ester carboxylesterase